MNLYIQLIDNQPANHPILKENLLQIFPDIDLENNTDYAKFERVQKPLQGPYTKSITGHYEFVGSVVKDIWVEEVMSAAEQLEKQNSVKAEWQQVGFTSWIFNEETCDFDPPVPYPDDTANVYIWNESIGNWEVITVADTE